MDALKIVFLFALLVPLSSATLVVDYCVADFNFPVGPAGYPCKNPATLTADDFVFSGLGVAANSTTTQFNASSVFAVDVTFPALNGLGLSIGRLDIGVGGAVPIHSHRASEVILVSEGTIIAGFIDTNNTAYYKTLNKGDIMIFPPTLLHFQVNVGKSPALAYVTLNSASPGFEITTFALAGNDFPSDLIQKITLVDTAQVKKLKRIFGGTN
ncbi:auxin-binding protein ABP19a [Beta vulgaris subsp. vulgaris]|uniref:auxin-binding protein ABP19a n=1 Tax=Beta vulgaris subsp. vulgaris TaxID=3555 RepID=UPI0020366802|nr:auxin-binding protein ABP19a [Beta vulgaris subsp. vulgaris]